MTVPLGGMTFKQLQDEVLTYRFSETQRGSSRLWINLRYGRMWAQAMWPFRISAPTAVAVTAGLAAGTFLYPNDVLRVLNVFDPNGNMLNYLPPREFQRLYQSQGNTGTPTDYTVISSYFFFGPTPDTTSAAYTASYERKMCYYNASDVLVPGNMYLDTDYPVFPQQFHYPLVLGAMSTGLKIVNDPTWQALEEEYQAQITAMQQDLLPADRGESITYGQALDTAGFWPGS